MSVTPRWFDEHMFDLGAHLDDLRSRPTGWLRARRAELIRERRRLRVEELAVTRVLDERGSLDPGTAERDGVSERTVRETVETARALETLPEIAAAAWEGDLSSEQLGPVVQLADHDSDAEWAERAPRVAPADLSRIAGDPVARPPLSGRGVERSEGLRIHHLVPRSHGGTDEPSNLAAVCSGGAEDHHHLLVPGGPWALVGSPNRPDGLRLVRVDRDHAAGRASPDARAGPDAA
jgi:hypothetical protein